jgi:hypothetical protein
MTHVAMPAENVTRSPREGHMEVLNPVTGDVWLLQEPITFEDYKALKVEPPLVKSGFGRGAMDAAYFQRSPGVSEDGPVETKTIDGRIFSRVARVRRFAGLSRGAAPTEVQVEKHHVLQFEAGRTVTLARLPDGHFYVEQTEASPGTPFAAPEGWRLFEFSLTARWTVELPCPARVQFFSSLRSFAGPLDSDALPRGPLVAQA